MMIRIFSDPSLQKLICQFIDQVPPLDNHDHHLSPSNKTNYQFLTLDDFDRTLFEDFEAVNQFTDINDIQRLQPLFSSPSAATDPPPPPPVSDIRFNSQESIMEERAFVPYWDLNSNGDEGSDKIMETQAAGLPVKKRKTRSPTEETTNGSFINDVESYNKSQGNKKTNNIDSADPKQSRTNANRETSGCSKMKKQNNMIEHCKKEVQQLKTKCLKLEKDLEKIESDKKLLPLEKEIIEAKTEAITNKRKLAEVLMAKQPDHKNDNSINALTQIMSILIKLMNANAATPSSPAAVTNHSVSYCNPNLQFPFLANTPNDQMQQIACMQDVLNQICQNISQASHSQSMPSLEHQITPHNT
ncbi:hypothetical protein O6P43_004042 [Quillaja saponaria]|uniref:BZIP domain-containing protein n=1 Tax=Quillaja saponaria TaxID=32244 RepID=A0AAD7Q2X4_QUISA|nr:hypothetical protein O6P43_004042 [Quillaja saponaria]